MLARDQTIGLGLFGFNVGLEVGQIIVVVIILIFAFIFISLLRIRQRDWIFFLSSGVFALSLKMALDRLPF